MKKILAGLGFLAVLGMAGYAIAQSYPPPQVANINPNSDLIQVVPNGSPSAQSVYATPAEVLATSGYIKIKPSNTLGGAGYVNTFTNYQSYLIYILPATMPYSYANFAPNPSDGARECMFAGGGTITLFYPTANAGQTLDNAVTTLASGTGVCYTYSLSNLTWDRS